MTDNGPTLGVNIDFYDDGTVSAGAAAAFCPQLEALLSNHSWTRPHPRQ